MFRGEPGARFERRVDEIFPRTPRFTCLGVPASLPGDWPEIEIVLHFTRGWPIVSACQIPIPRTAP